MTTDQAQTRMDAEYNLGLIYLYGKGVQQNHDLATIWLQKAANKGHPKAIELLATIQQEARRVIYPEKCIHTTIRGEKVRSKSEVIIANMLYQYKLEYAYERPFRGLLIKGMEYPDFTLFALNGEIILWEHLGLMSNREYKLNWGKKKLWYEQNGLLVGKSLFISKDMPNGSIDSQEIYDIVSRIYEIIHAI